MTRFVLIPGAGGVASYWNLVVALLRDAGHEAIPVDLPGDDQSAGLPEYVDLVVDAIDQHSDAVLVAQSLGGFTAAIVASRVPLRAIALVNAMIPVPGETPGEWWGDTGSLQARTETAQRRGYATEFDPFVYFLHDVPAEVIAASEPPRAEADAVFDSACDFVAWPHIPIHAVAGADDRFFPLDFQQRVARERLGIELDVLPGGHLIALAQPAALADYLQRIV